MLMVILTLIILILDICSKLIVSNYLSVGENIQIIKKFLSITYVKNTGAAWSLFDDRTILVLIISSIIIVGIMMYICKNKPKYVTEKVAYSMILGGALGNFINRLIYGYVVDFIDIKIFGYDYPIFNLADTFIVIGVIILIIFTWRCNDGRDKGIRK